MKSEILPISKYLTQFVSPLLSIEEREYFTIIADLIITGLNHGHSCVDLRNICHCLQLSNKEIIALLIKSKLASVYELGSGLAPMPLTILKLKNKELVYITKYLHYELAISNKIHQLTSEYSEVQTNLQFINAIRLLHEISLKHNLPNLEQLQAIENSAKQKFSIITGGPGTGKTTTVTLLLWLLGQIYGQELKIKVAAPTGKAANRVQESIRNSIRFFKDKQLALEYSLLENLLADSGNFSTLHKLLGYQANSIHFKHNQKNPLDLDVLIIDESSMIGLPLFSKLLNAINPGRIKHLIFLGDRNQLSSVEEGYVFASLVESSQNAFMPIQYDLFSEISPSILRELVISNRNKGDIGKLSQAILKEDIPKVFELLANSQAISLHEIRLPHIIRETLASKPNSVIEYLNYAKLFDSTSMEPSELFSRLSKQIILCLTNQGVFGVENLNTQIEKSIRRILAINEEWYTGRPIIILENDYSLGIFNGDIGIAICKEGKTSIIFDNNLEYIPEVLPKYRLAYAITIHKSQGSEYDHVNIVLPEISISEEQQLLSRELIYTAVTRARTSITLFATIAAIEAAIVNKTIRTSGLGLLLQQ